MSQHAGGGATAGPQGARLAGLVMAVLGPLTFGTTSPFGLMLSAEKFWEPDRPPRYQPWDAVGVILSVLGCLYLPFFLWGMCVYDLIGPVPVMFYLAFLALWSWHRVRAVWGWPRRSP